MGKRPIYYDTETTGVRTKADRIVEIAAYDAERDTSFVSFINPEIPIPQEASAIHNITDEMVSDAPLFAEVASNFMDFCDGDVVLIAHNNDSFDKPMLENEFQRHALDIPDWPYIDSLKWARRYRPDLPRHALQFLREVYGFPANQAHRALDDVIVLRKVFEAMIDDLDMDQILELMSKPQALSRMPFGKHQGKPLSEIPKDYVKWLDKSGAFDRPDNAQLKEAFASHGLL